MTENVWLNSFGRRISNLLTHIEEQRLKGGYGGSLNLNEVITLFKGAQNEIVRQDTEIKSLNEKIKSLENAVKRQDDDMKKLAESIKQPAGPEIKSKNLLQKRYLSKKK